MLLEVDDDAWQVLAQSLALSARSKGSTPELRKQISRALTKLREVRGRLLALTNMDGTVSVVACRQLTGEQLTKVNKWSDRRFNQKLEELDWPEFTENEEELRKWIRCSNGELDVHFIRDLLRESSFAHAMDEAQGKGTDTRVKIAHSEPQSRAMQIVFKSAKMKKTRKG